MLTVFLCATSLWYYLDVLICVSVYINFYSVFFSFFYSFYFHGFLWILWSDSNKDDDDDEYEASIRYSPTLYVK